MHLLFLGTGGWIPTSRRQTSSVLIRDGDRGLILDAGTGVARLLEDSAVLSNISRLDIVLSHFHLDHIVGLAYLPALPEGIPKFIWGAGAALYGRSTEDILGNVLHSPTFFTERRIADGWGELNIGSNDCGGWQIQTRAQRHSDPSIAIRVGDKLTYCTDTTYDEGNSNFSRGAPILLHEAWIASDTSQDPFHTSAGDAARVAEAAGVEHLYLIHIDARLASTDGLQARALANFPRVTVASDLLEVNLA